MSKIYTVQDLANKFNVTTRTIYRWKKSGLISPIPGSRIPVFSDETIQEFIKNHPDMSKIRKKVTKITDLEKQKLLENAQQLLQQYPGWSINKICKTIHQHTGRSIEAIRLAIKDKIHIDRTNKTQLLNQCNSIEFVDSPDFHKPNADNILSDDSNMFKKMNYLKFKAAQMHTQGNHCEEKRLIEKSRQIRNNLILKNIKLVYYSIPKYDNNDELISIGFMMLMKAVDSFDYTKNTKFSTYAVSKIKRKCIEVISKENKHKSIYITNIEYDTVDTVKDEENIDTIKVRKTLDCLPKRQRFILEQRFGLTGDPPKTLEEIGNQLGLSKERIRQIELEAKQQFRLIY